MKSIIFSTPMVQAILDGRKTQTRRIVKPQPSSGIRKSVFVKSGLEDGHGREIKSRYQPSDILWVRETWCNYNNKFYYKADKKCYGCTEDGICMPRGIESHITCKLCESVGVDGYIRWRPSIHMPREAARIFLKVTSVKVERLQDISEEDARAEGCITFHCKTGDGKFEDVLEFDLTARDAFCELWQRLNLKRGYGWETNPWVFVYEFEKISKDETERLEKS